jgi:hypothetical protein
MNKTADPSRTQLIAALGLAALLALWVWIEVRGLNSTRDSLRSAERQLSSMTEDAAVVARLRTAPKLATERERPNDDLLSQIREALKDAQVSLDRWKGNEPSPAVRVADTPYRRLDTRLSFEKVTMRQMVEFAHALARKDSTLRVTDFRLAAASGGDRGAWSAQLVVSYLIYAPVERP